MIGVRPGLSLCRIIPSAPSPVCSRSYHSPHCLWGVTLAWAASQRNRTPSLPDSSRGQPHTPFPQQWGGTSCIPPVMPPETPDPSPPLIVQEGMFQARTTERTPPDEIRAAGHPRPLNLCRPDAAINPDRCHCQQRVCGALAINDRECQTGKTRKREEKRTIMHWILLSCRSYLCSGSRTWYHTR
jgi:hypothetical protein